MEIRLPITCKRKPTWRYVLIVFEGGIRLGIEPKPINCESFFDWELIWRFPMGKESRKNKRIL